MSDQNEEGQKLILDALSKAYEDAQARVNGIGMSNSYGLSGAEKVALDMAYEKARDDLVQAKRALEEYIRQIAK